MPLPAIMVIEPTNHLYLVYADALSAARPGARQESIDNYIKRLQNLERNFNGLKA